MLNALTALLLLLGGCAEGSNTAMTLDDQTGMVSAPSGDYRDLDGRVFSVSTSGAVALSVRNDADNICLRFWRDKEPTGEDRLLRLRGQTCENTTFGELDWTAMYSYDKPSMFILYPPGAFTDAETKPIEIRHIGD